MKKTSFLACLAGVLFFAAFDAACSGAGSEPGSEFVGKWATDIQESFGVGGSTPVSYKLILEIVHNNDKQYFITAYFSSIDKETLPSRCTLIAFYKDGILELGEECRLDLLVEEPGQRRPECTLFSGNKCLSRAAQKFFQEGQRAIIHKASDSLNLGEYFTRLK